MSSSLTSRSRDLRRLRDEGYELEIIDGFLIVGHIPYVTESRKIKYGKLVSPMTLQGDVTAVPSDHVAHFIGGAPCDADGRPLTKLIIQSTPIAVRDGLVTTHAFSSKPPPPGYVDYHHKMTTYAAALSGHAEQIDPSATARTFRPVRAERGDPFVYIDTASSRAGIPEMTAKLALKQVGVVGAGGTAGYIIDLLAKTPVQQIHIFDGDVFQQHNAYRGPGAASLAQLRAAPTKVEYFAGIYSNMHRGIRPHPFHIDESNVHRLDSMDFVFIAVDDGSAKDAIITRLESRAIPFIDVGMGIYEAGGQLAGTLRVTASTDTPGSRSAARSRISVGATPPDDYARNIQVADLNALNAAIAVIKYKMLLGFYVDADATQFAAYVIASNTIINEDPQ